MQSINWVAPEGSLCSCCDKPVPPKRPSLAARAAADASTVGELKSKNKKLQGLVKSGTQSLAAVKKEIAVLREVVNTKQERAETLSSECLELHAANAAQHRQVVELLDINKTQAARIAELEKSLSQVGDVWSGARSRPKSNKGRKRGAYHNLVRDRGVAHAQSATLAPNDETASV